MKGLLCHSNITTLSFINPSPTMERQVTNQFIYIFKLVAFEI